MYTKFGHEQSPLGEYEWRYMRQLIAEWRHGWTMDYIDSLSYLEVQDLFAVRTARHKAEKS
jgi:hypothetical protein